MITKIEAESLAQEQLRKMEKPDLPFAINDSKTLERPFGWVFFYNSKKFIETRDIRYQLAGNGPIVVNKHSRAVTVLGTNKPVQALIEEYEKLHSSSP